MVFRGQCTLGFLKKQFGNVKPRSKVMFLHGHCPIELGRSIQGNNFFVNHLIKSLIPCLLDLGLDFDSFGFPRECVRAYTWFA